MLIRKVMDRIHSVRASERIKGNTTRRTGLRLGIALLAGAIIIGSLAAGYRAYGARSERLRQAALMAYAESFTRSANTPPGSPVNAFLGALTPSSLRSSLHPISRMDMAHVEGRIFCFNESWRPRCGDWFLIVFPAGQAEPAYVIRDGRKEKAASADGLVSDGAPVRVFEWK